jgi:glycosyltransferase involved in cell wall biosynthesis
MIVTAVSDCPIEQKHQKQKEVKGEYKPEDLIGRRMPRELIVMDDFVKRDRSQLRIAFVCNWNDQCGISTYSKFLVEAIKPLVADIKIFSEVVEKETHEDEEYVDRCWKRGDSLKELSSKISEWNPDFTIIQHEFGIFPNAFYFMKFMEEMKKFPHVVTMHSVYQHLDKVIYTESMSHIVTHSDKGRKCLRRNGNTAEIYYIPHGCVQLEETSEIWNNLQSPYTILQFGFGFKYKGVEDAIKAVAHLVKTDPKFKNLYYIYLCSENANSTLVHEEYYEYLRKTCEELGVSENVCILRKYQTDEMLSLYIRLAKLCVFPYVTDPNNVVYGESGAIRIAMAHNTPTLASTSRMFSDLQGVVPRIPDYKTLARHIDEVFSNDKYRDEILRRARKYVKENSWDIVGKKYLDLYNEIVA